MIKVNSMEDMSTLNETNTTSPVTGTEIAGEYAMAHKIDRLSLLPNELLDYIFDLAYSIDTPSTGPLSKRLLPFHITGIYRRISLTDPDNIAKLVRKIGEQSDLGETVKMIRLDCQSDLLGVFNTLESTEIEQFFRQLVRLEWLDLGDDRYEWLDKLASTHNSTSTAPLRHITSGASCNSQRPLVNFTSFATLRSLYIMSYERPYDSFDVRGLSPLPLLSSLTISGTYAESLSIASFCTLCPNLTSVSLESPAPNYTPLLEILSASLTHLELDIRSNHEGNPCGQELLRFTHLRHLSIGSSLFPYNLPEYLKSSLDLESLTLGEGHVSLDGLIQLIRELPSLGYIKLDSFGGFVGSRLKIDVTKCQASGLPAADKRFGNDWDSDWDVPSFSNAGVEANTFESAREMLRVAEEAGVRVEGSIVEAVRVMKAYYLELANVIIYRCFRYKTLYPYNKLQDRGLGSRLPPLDLTSLDPQKLKLVKTELPDEGWFALSLEAANE